MMSSTSSSTSKFHPTMHRISLADDEFADEQDCKLVGSRTRKCADELDNKLSSSRKRKCAEDKEKAGKSARGETQNEVKDGADKQTTVILSAIADLKSSLEAKLSDLADRLTSQLKEEFDKEIKNVRLEMNREVKSLDEYIHAVENFAKTQPCSDENEALNKIVFMNLPEEEDEEVADTVTYIIREKLNLPDMSILSAERKRSYSARKPGIVIVTCLSLDDKIIILKNKMNLKSTRDFKDVYIVPYSTRSEQKQMKSLKKMVQIMGEDKLVNLYNYRSRDVSRTRDYVDDGDVVDDYRRRIRRRSPGRDEHHKHRSRTNH